MKKSKIKNQYLREAIDKMFDMVNADENIDVNSELWFFQHEWTYEQMNEFFDWLCNKMKNRKFYKGFTNMGYGNNKKNREKIANTFIFQYGWKLKSPEE